jgi:hypothetical protein
MMYNISITDPAIWGYNLKKALVDPLGNTVYIIFDNKISSYNISQNNFQLKSEL